MVSSRPSSPSWCCACSSPGSASLGTSRAEWPADVVQVDGTSGYEVRISSEALPEARAGSRRGTRIRGPKIETGSMLLGAFDDATGIVYVDKVAGPRPDSYLAETYFQHGVRRTAPPAFRPGRKAGWAVDLARPDAVRVFRSARPARRNDSVMALSIR